MTMELRKYKFMLLRRATALGVLALFLGTEAFGWTVLRGNLSAAEFMGYVPLADPYHLLQMFSALAVPSSEVLVGALIVLLFSGLVAGRAFCGWVCPLNLVTDSANWLKRKLGLDDAYVISRTLRYWVLGLSLPVSALVGAAAFEWISPVSMLHRGVVFGMGLGWVAVLSVFLLDLLVSRNGFCGHLCPLGGFYSIFGRYGAIKPKYKRDKCNMCMKCFEVCPERQVLGLVGNASGWVLSGECINCGRCIEVCDERAIKFGIKSLINVN